MPKPDDILDALRAGGVLTPGEDPDCTPLTGGVSSDIWRIDLASGPVCVKRALAKLKVADDWHAPVSRNAFEVAWMQTVRAIAPSAVPDVIFHDPETGLFAMTYIEPETAPVWKTLLRDGVAEPENAAAVGDILGRIHTATSTDPDIPARFDNDEIFHAIRLEPYLLATAERCPDVADRLRELADITASNKVALVHGDVSPKNILIGPDGPVFLDAECAWFGDPAFDLAFCLNHLLLKCLWAPSARPGFKACFEALTASYEAATTDIADRAIPKRTAHLLAGLFLARVDGKSPAEYITADADKEHVRTVAREFLTNPADHPIDICHGWHAHLNKNQ
ncbi:MAG: aminoglycoside phosphotransferase family protein [Rhodospirillales bacterium]|nr:aminoglycoside phosphotransferase family protein [Rhodospirillales bacterium]MBO6786144.1 aminoglycoside phosphotransferase family protein [Rhodospirillales bacterium]